MNKLNKNQAEAWVQAITDNDDDGKIWRAMKEAQERLWKVR